MSAVCAATIVAELGTPSDFDHPRQVLKLAGMNLVSASSGQRDQARVPKWQSKRGRPALRRQLFLLAGRWCQQDGLYRADYEALLARGSTRTKAVCSIARKLVPLLLAVMRSGEGFDATRWLANRHQRAAAWDKAGVTVPGVEGAALPPYRIETRASGDLRVQNRRCAPSDPKRPMKR